MAVKFSDIALHNAVRFRVFPLKGHSKEPAISGWPDAATTDINQIQQWAKQFPNANVGIACGNGITGLDTDRSDRLYQLCPSLIPRTFQTTSGRPNRCHFYFLETPESAALGNMKWKEAGHDGNVYEIKGHGAYLVAEGSIHPDTGEPYRVVADLPIIPFPTTLIQKLRELRGAEGEKPQWSLPVHDGEYRRGFMVQQAGKLRNAGCSKEVILAHLVEINANPEVIADPLPDEELEKIARSIERYAPTAPEPLFLIAESKAPAEIVAAAKRSRPVYPIGVWEGTAAGEFAKLCAHDNNIPRKLYVEAFRTVLGAVVGDRLSCSVDGCVPRCYTILLAPFGKGKGTAIRRAVQFFQASWQGSVLSPGLLTGDQDFIWKPQGIGARQAIASSVPGMAALLQEGKNAKSTPHMVWRNTVPRFLFLYEEMKNFFSALYVEGGVGTGMEGAICQLWDDVEFFGAATGKRAAQHGRMQLSILGGVTAEDWPDLVSKGNAIGGGLMSRLNLIGTEGGYENVSKMSMPDFSILRDALIPRIQALADAPVQINPEPGAEAVIAEWTKALPEGSQRANVQVWRTALVMAWLRRLDHITVEVAEAAVKLGEYQIQSHEHYWVERADSQYAGVQHKILRALETKGALTLRELQRATNSSRYGTRMWNDALAGLLKDRQLGRREGDRNNQEVFYRATV